MFIGYDEQDMALYLITGIGGFIGSSLARALLARGEQVRGVDNFSTGKRENLNGIAAQSCNRRAIWTGLSPNTGRQSSQSPGWRWRMRTWDRRCG